MAQSKIENNNKNCIIFIKITFLVSLSKKRRVLKE